MRISIAIWTTFVALSASVAIAAHYLQLPILHWIAKPLTTLLIVGMALSLSSAEPVYRRWIVIGLLWSTLGDVFLMLPGDYFLHGLVSFLVAHIAYLVAFSRRERLFAQLMPFAVYAVIAFAVLTYLSQGIPAPMRIPVVVYVAALGAMAAQAAAIWSIRRDRASALAAIGGALFMFSDSLIAINRFGEPFDASRFLVLASYWLAQYLIARSIGSNMVGTSR
jgi:uncharacterized membrane protein YhhN